MSESTLDALIEVYGAGDHTPTRDRWQTLLAGEPNAPLVVTNLFRVRAQADPEWIDGESLSGFESMLRYSAVSVAKVEALGGSFATQAIGQGTLIGDDAEWNLIAVAQYPKREQFVSLFQDPEYQAAYRYRTAAVEAQKVILGSPL